MRVLVTYGSSNGSTAGLAEMIADALRSHGIATTVADASSDPDPGRVEAVVVGGALYGMRWHKDARRYVTRHIDELESMPVFFFSSGPLDDRAERSEIPPVGGVHALMERVGATSHATFGGRLAPDGGFVSSRITEQAAADYRDADHVSLWVTSVAARLVRATAASH